MKDKTTSGLIADLHTRIAQAEIRNAELDSLIDARQKDKLTPADLAAAFADFDELWDPLIPREQAEIIHLLDAWIEFNPKESAVSVTFHPTAIQTLMKSKLGGAA